MRFLDSERAQNIFLLVCVGVIIITVVAVACGVVMALANGL